jgi:hypothetical protein
VQSVDSQEKDDSTIQGDLLRYMNEQLGRTSNQQRTMTASVGAA